MSEKSEKKEQPKDDPVKKPKDLSLLRYIADKMGWSYRTRRIVNYSIDFFLIGLFVFILWNARQECSCVEGFTYEQYLACSDILVGIHGEEFRNEIYRFNLTDELGNPIYVEINKSSIP